MERNKQKELELKVSHINLSEEALDTIWYDIVNVINRHWKSKANNIPLIQKIFDSWVLLVKNVVYEEIQKERWENMQNNAQKLAEEFRKENTELKEKVKTIEAKYEKEIREKDTKLKELQSKNSELEGNQNIKITEKDIRIYKRKVENELNIPNRRLWDIAWDKR